MAFEKCQDRSHPKQRDNHYKKNHTVHHDIDVAHTTPTATFVYIHPPPQPPAFPATSTDNGQTTRTANLARRRLHALRHIHNVRHRLVELGPALWLHLRPRQLFIRVLDHLQKTQGWYVTGISEPWLCHANSSRLSIAESANLAPWFPPHLQKEIYSTLLELDADKDRKTKVPEGVIRAALLRRAVEDIARIIQVRQAKQALNTLLQRGSVGEDLNQRFQRAEKEIEEELKDVVMEVRCALRFPPLIHLLRRLLPTDPFLGQCPCPRLGPDHLPIRQRNRC